MHKLWNVTLITVPQLADAMAEVLEDRALALTVLAPPRKEEARIEALYDIAPRLADITARAALVAAMYGAKIPQIDIRETPNLDWLKKVAGDFPPMRLARWTVFGSQHKKSVRPGRFTMQIDATSAFGTGEHPTTRGCLMMLDALLKKERPWRMLDMGCGSGILAMAWAEAARGHAVAVDLDSESVRVAKENIRVNGLQRNVTIGLSYGYRSPLVAKAAPYDLIMANIFARPLCEMAKDLKCHLRPGGTAILAGLLNRQANAVLAAHRMQGLYLKKRIIIGEWSILALDRAKRAK